MLIEFCEKQNFPLIRFDGCWSKFAPSGIPRSSHSAPKPVTQEVGDVCVAEEENCQCRVGVFLLGKKNPKPSSVGGEFKHFDKTMITWVVVCVCVLVGGWDLLNSNQNLEEGGELKHLVKL